MNPERWAHIQRVFDAAVEMEPQARVAYLEKICQDDADLRREIESLLEAHKDADFLERSSREIGRKLSSTLQTGDRLHQYQILSLLGAGGMGEVYLALDTRLHRRVALKLLPRNPNFLRDQLRRFEQEARAASALSHPNVCVIYEINETGSGDHYIAMEHVEGITLRERLSGPIPVEEALGITRQLAAALSAAHQAGIIHRDIKPENIMLRPDGLVKLLDFGVAKLYVGEQDATAELSILRTQPGVVVGTYRYMSPEQARGTQVDARADLWSLGVVLREMLTGSAPFVGATGSDVLVAILTKEPAPLVATLPKVSTWLQQVDRRLLAKDAQKRYQSAAELLRDLQPKSGELTAAPFWGALRSPSMSLTLVFATVILMLLAAAGTGWLYYRRVGLTRSSNQLSEPDQRRVVAVLPFQNISNDASQEYFSSGMTEEISGQLSKLASLQLISRAAAAQYKESHGNLRQIASDLGVGSVVMGSVRQNAGRVRINVELVETRNERTVWAEQYDRELKDIFAVQSDIAVRIAQALGAALSQSEREHIDKPPTGNMAAYQLYLESQALSLSVSKDNLQAIHMLQKAWAMDPQFALALAKISYRQMFQAYLGDPRYGDLAIESSRQAVSIDPSLAEAHFALASAYMIKGERSKARFSFLKALELKPNFVEAMNNYSLEEADSGRADQAMYWAARSFRLAPNSGNSYYHLAAPLLILGDDATTLRWLTEGEERHPDSSRVQIMRAIFDFVHLGKREEGLRRIRDALHTSPDDEEIQGLLEDLSLAAGDPAAGEHLQHLAQTGPEGGGQVLVETNRLKHAFLLQRHGHSQTALPMFEQAESSARKMVESGDETFPSRIELAALYSLRGDRQKALEWLELAYATGARDYRTLQIDPFFEKLRADPQFKEIVGRMANDVAQMRERAREQLPEIFAPGQRAYVPPTLCRSGGLAIWRITK
jgi:eukaryotic-like serine/threonine-protein kinase